MSSRMGGPAHQHNGIHGRPDVPMPDAAAPPPPAHKDPGGLFSMQFTNALYYYTIWKTAEEELKRTERENTRQKAAYAAHPIIRERGANKLSQAQAALAEAKDRAAPHMKKLDDFIEKMVSDRLSLKEVEDTVFQAREIIRTAPQEQEKLRAEFKQQINAVKTEEQRRNYAAIESLKIKIKGDMETYVGRLLTEKDKSSAETIDVKVKNRLNENTLSLRTEYNKAIQTAVSGFDAKIGAVASDVAAAATRAPSNSSVQANALERLRTEMEECSAEMQRLSKDMESMKSSRQGPASEELTGLSANLATLRNEFDRFVESFDDRTSTALMEIYENFVVPEIVQRVAEIRPTTEVVVVGGGGGGSNGNSASIAPDNSLAIAAMSKAEDSMNIANDVAANLQSVQDQCHSVLESCRAIINGHDNQMSANLQALVERHKTDLDGVAMTVHILNRRVEAGVSVAEIAKHINMNMRNVSTEKVTQLEEDNAKMAKELAEIKQLLLASNSESINAELADLRLKQSQSTHRLKELGDQMIPQLMEDVKTLKQGAARKPGSQWEVTYNK